MGKVRIKKADSFYQLLAVLIITNKLLGNIEKR